MQTIRRLITYAPRTRQTATLMTLVVIERLSILLVPLLLGLAVDASVAGSTATPLGPFGPAPLLITLAAATMLIAILGYARVVIVASLARHASIELRTDLTSAMAFASISTLRNYSRGDLLARSTQDVDATEALFEKHLTTTLEAAIDTAAVLFVMTQLNLGFAAAAVIPTLAMMMVVAALTRSTRDALVEYQNRRSNLSEVLDERITGHRLTLAHHRLDQATERFDDSHNAVIAVGRRAHRPLVLIIPSTASLETLSMALIAGVGGVLAARGNDVTPGAVVTFIAYASALREPVSGVVNMVGAALGAVAGATRYFSALDDLRDKPEPSAPEGLRGERAQAARATLPTSGEIVFDNVGFSYDDDALVLRNLSLRVPRGAVVGIVGASGAGKTTILSLLHRLHEPCTGTITIGARPLCDFAVEHLRHEIAVVPQEPWLLHGTIRDNVRLTRPSASDQQVEEAVRLACASEIVSGLPHGLDTIVGSTADELSLGMRQLIALARCALNDPQIIVLDEAASAVDEATEQQVRASLRGLSAGRTMIIVTHRVESLLPIADQILVIEDGRVAQRITPKRASTTRAAFSSAGVPGP